MIAACAITQAAGAFSTEPFLSPMQDLERPWPAYPPAVEALSAAATAALVVLGVACGVSLVLRFRGAKEVVRAQLKWLPLAGLAAVAYPIVCVTEIAITGDTGNVSVAVGIVALVGLPVSVAIAMLRHDLYDVDRVLADSISYVIVVAVLVATYILSASALGLVLGRDSAPAAAGATAICALLLAPVRTRLRRTVDRPLFPPRRAALQAIEDLQQTKLGLLPNVEEHRRVLAVLTYLDHVNGCRTETVERSTAAVP